MTKTRRFIAPLPVFGLIFVVNMGCDDDENSEINTRNDKKIIEEGPADDSDSDTDSGPDSDSRGGVDGDTYTNGDAGAALLIGGAAHPAKPRKPASSTSCFIILITSYRLWPCLR